jgi:hypothetical protein
MWKVTFKQILIRIRILFYYWQDSKVQLLHKLFRVLFTAIWSGWNIDLYLLSLSATGHTYISEESIILQIFHVIHHNAYIVVDLWSNLHFWRKHYIANISCNTSKCLWVYSYLDEWSISDEILSNIWIRMN